MVSTYHTGTLLRAHLTSRCHWLLLVAQPVRWKRYHESRKSVQDLSLALTSPLLSLYCSVSREAWATVGGKEGAVLGPMKYLHWRTTGPVWSCPYSSLWYAILFKWPWGTITDLLTVTQLSQNSDHVLFFMAASFPGPPRCHWIVLDFA